MGWWVFSSVLFALSFEFYLPKTDKNGRSYLNIGYCILADRCRVASFFFFFPTNFFILLLRTEFYFKSFVDLLTHEVK